MRHEILNIIVNAVTEMNSTLDSELPIHLEENCPLYHDSIALDSISLVTLIVAIEQAIEDQFNFPIILANEKAMSRRNSPFLTIGTLTNYILDLMKEEQHA